MTMVCISLLLVLEMPLSLRGDDYRYATNAGTITITSYTGPGGVVAVPASVQGLPVTSIGNEAFIYCGDVLEVAIPDTVTSLGDAAFYGCFSLTAVTLPEGLTSIGEQAFRWCLSLGGVHIPASVSSIGELAFNSCESLLAISVEPQNATYSSRDGLLLDHSQTTLITFPAGLAGDVTLPDGLVTIGLAALASCHFVSSVAVPGSVTTIEEGAFANCSLAGISLPNGVTNIGRYAFSSCPNLAEVVIPGSVTGLQEGVFKDCPSLTRITIPGSINSIGYGAFANCTALTNVDILTGVNSIAKQAFYECTALFSVVMPNSVTVIGAEAFFYCTNLAAVYCEGNAPSPGLYAFDFDDHATIYYLPETTGWAETYGGRPTAIWRPRIQAADGNFGVSTNHFGFTIAWASDKMVVVEACPDLAQPAWSPIGTNTLDGGSSYFVDPEPANRPRCYYRVRAL